MERHTDVAVVGGSAAGLAAALQIARQRRGVVVIDDQAPRNASAAHMHGYLGHEGVAPTDLVRAVARRSARSAARSSSGGSWPSHARRTAASGST